MGTVVGTAVEALTAIVLPAVRTAQPAVTPLPAECRPGEAARFGTSITIDLTALQVWWIPRCGKG